jgi:ring-1,2-phenylacetyl-CoA epoxidase subunit PaaE
MSDFHSLTISEVNTETPNAVSISFSVPEQLNDIFRFKAGQYITIKHIHNGTELRRAYSICSSPASGTLRIGVKAVDGGAFSQYANTVLQVGDTLEVMPPQGKFTLEAAPEKSQEYIAFAAGSGITPVLSLVTTALEENSNARFVLVFGNRSLEETMFHKDLLQLTAKYPERLYIEFIYSRRQEGDAMFGRIERSTVNYILKSKFAERNFDAYYLCGPEPMIDEVTSVLKEHGINEKQIHSELFTTSEEGLLVEKHEGDTQVTVTLDDEEFTFSMPQTKSVLDAALDEGLDAPYSCQGGICSTCIARLTEGKVEMRKNQILTDGELAEGLILTCQSHPTTSRIVVDYDDA